jgi:hypothetical protein
MHHATNEKFPERKWEKGFMMFVAFISWKENPESGL